MKNSSDVLRSMCSALLCIIIGFFGWSLKGTVIVPFLEMGKPAQGGKYLVQGHQLVNNRAVWPSPNHLICLTSYPTPNPKPWSARPGKRGGSGASPRPSSMSRASTYPLLL